MRNLLKEQITNKKVLQILLVVGILCFAIEYGQSEYGEEQDSVAVSANYQGHDGAICREVPEGYEVVLYNNENEEVFSMGYLEESNYLTVDWTDFEILMGHSIEPEDSGRGWEFSVADVDFDGTLELLVTFAANHCGQNALYIYKQENGRVFSFADTNAVFGKYVVSDIDYKAISPYMDIDLLAAYKNQNDEYRYLSLDYSIFGGNERGDIGTVTLYETILDQRTTPMKLAEISYVLPEEKVEMYFRGERIYEAGELKDRLDEYMEGYTELEIKYETAAKSFSRDIVAQSDEYKAKELEELYKSLEELFAEYSIEWSNF